MSARPRVPTSRPALLASLRVSLTFALPLVLAVACAPNWGGGIHARMGHSDEEGLRVIEVPEDGPAARAGLSPGDRIVTIDDAPIDGLTTAQVVERLRGPVGSTVELGIRRGGRAMTLEVTRAPYE